MYRPRSDFVAFQVLIDGKFPGEVNVITLSFGFGVFLGRQTYAFTYVYMMTLYVIPLFRLFYPPLCLGQGPDQDVKKIFLYAVTAFIIFERLAVPRIAYAPVRACIPHVKAPFPQTTGIDVLRLRSPVLDLDAAHSHRACTIAYVATEFQRPSFPFPST
jgi:hypothetical protein